MLRSTTTDRVAASAVVVISAFFAFAPDRWLIAVVDLGWTETTLALTRTIFLVIGGGAAVLLWRSFKLPSSEPPTHVGE